MNRRARFRVFRRASPDRRTRRRAAGSDGRTVHDHPESQPIVGNATDDGAQSAGWFVGPFLDPAHAGLRATSAFEVKWSAHQAGDRRRCWVVDHSRATVVILIRGRLRLQLRDADQVLSKSGDYIIWGSGTDHSWIAEESCLVVTFRLPPEPTDRQERGSREGH